MTIDPDETLRQKVDAVLRKHLVDPNRFVGNLLLRGEVYSAISAAFSSYIRDDVADDIALNMLDWSKEAEFLFALYLQPDVFTKEEVDQGIRAFLCHAAMHIRNAARIVGFEGDDRGES
jgi:hypothetical protein